MNDIPIVWIELGRKLPNHLLNNVRFHHEKYPDYSQYLVTDQRVPRKISRICTIVNSATLDLNIISDEIGKSKPATLFFLSKYGCQLETIKFYSTITENWVWENSDIIITSNPKLLEKKIEGKVLIKYETTYNVESYSDYTIKTLEEFKELYKTLKLKQDD